MVRHLQLCLASFRQDQLGRSGCHTKWLRSIHGRPDITAYETQGIDNGQSPQDQIRSHKKSQLSLSMAQPLYQHHLYLTSSLLLLPGRHISIALDFSSQTATPAELTEHHSHGSRVPPHFASCCPRPSNMATYELTVHQLLARLALEDNSQHTRQSQHQRSTSKRQAFPPTRKDSMDLVVVSEHTDQRQFRRTTSISSSISTDSEISGSDDWSETEIDFTHRRAQNSEVGRK